MALTDKKYSAVHNKTGGDKDKLKANYDDGHINTFADLADNGTNPEFGALIYQIQEMQEELDYLRTEISNNKDKVTFPGLGTSSTTALAGDTKLVSIGPKTTLSFADMVATTVKGKTTYTIALSVTTDFGGKTGSVTKSITLTLT